MSWQDIWVIGSTGKVGYDCEHTCYFHNALQDDNNLKLLLPELLRPKLPEWTAGIDGVLNDLLWRIFGDVTALFTKLRWKSRVCAFSFSISLSRALGLHSMSCTGVQRALRDGVLHRGLVLGLAMLGTLRAWRQHGRMFGSRKEQRLISTSSASVGAQILGLWPRMYPR